MKKIIAISMIGLFLAGCKKNYECWCGMPAMDIYAPTFVTHDTKKAATKKCDEKQSELRTENPTTDPDFQYSCGLH
ncbi:MAG: hypothetical protein KF900_09050 [Bacteroidetes bacterium]|nr:hypothetical protein [Bacteroidota bacterium]